MRGHQRGNPTSCPLALLTGAKDDAKSTVFSAYSPQLVEELERRDKATGSVDAALFLEAMPFVLRPPARESLARRARCARRSVRPAGRSARPGAGRG